jgi:phage portal protein BeeE
MSFYSGTIAPIVKQYADELTVKLLTERQVSKGYCFDTANDVFDMLDAQTKATVLCAYKGAGILSANEARASLQYPAKKGGDELVTVGTGGTLGDNAGKDGGGDTTEEGK